MIVVDNALRARAEAGRPIRVGVLGAGFMAQGLTNTIVNDVPGMRLVAIYGRKVERAAGIYEYAGLNDSVLANTQGAFEDAIRAGRPVITEDAIPPRALRADRRHRRHDGFGRIRCPPRVGVVRARQGRRPDERRDRRDDRTDLADVRREI